MTQKRITEISIVKENQVDAEFDKFLFKDKQLFFSSDISLCLFNLYMFF